MKIIKQCKNQKRDTHNNNRNFAIILRKQLLNSDWEKALWQNVVHYGKKNTKRESLLTGPKRLCKNLNIEAHVRHLKMTLPKLV